MPLVVKRKGEILTTESKRQKTDSGVSAPSKKYYETLQRLSYAQDEWHTLVRITPSEELELRKLVAKYVGSFLNGKGGILVFGVSKTGFVYGDKINRKEEDNFRLVIDETFKKFKPMVRPDMYRITFTPVRERGKNVSDDLQVVEIRVAPGERYELYQDEFHEAFLRRGDTAHGPLTPHEIKMHTLKQCTEKLLAEKRFVNLLHEKEDSNCAKERDERDDHLKMGNECGKKETVREECKKNKGEQKVGTKSENISAAKQPDSDSRKDCSNVTTTSSYGATSSHCETLVINNDFKSRTKTVEMVSGAHHMGKAQNDDRGPTKIHSTVNEGSSKKDADKITVAESGLGQALLTTVQKKPGSRESASSTLKLNQSYRAPNKTDHGVLLPPKADHRVLLPSMADHGVLLPSMAVSAEVAGRHLCTKDKENVPVAKSATGPLKDSTSSSTATTAGGITVSAECSGEVDLCGPTARTRDMNKEASTSRQDHVYHPAVGQANSSNRQVIITHSEASSVKTLSEQRDGGLRYLKAGGTQANTVASAMPVLNGQPGVQQAVNGLDKIASNHLSSNPLGRPPEPLGRPPELQAKPPQPLGRPPEPQARPPEPQARPPEPLGRPPEPQARPPQPLGRPPAPQARPPQPQGMPPDPLGRYPEPQGRHCYSNNWSSTAGPYPPGMALLNMTNMFPRPFPPQPPHPTLAPPTNFYPLLRPPSFYH